MILKLSCNDLFQHLGDGPVVGLNLRVEGGFFQKWLDDSCFESRWSMARVQREVYCVSDERTYGREVGFDQCCGKGVQDAGDWFHFPDERFYFTL